MFKETSVIEFVLGQTAEVPLYDATWINQDVVATCGGNAETGMIYQCDLRAKDVVKVFRNDCASRSISRMTDNILATTWDSGDVLITDLRSSAKPLALIEPIMYKGDKVRAHAIDLIESKGWLIIGYDHFARIWDATKGTEIWRNVSPESDAINAVAHIDVPDSTNVSIFAYSTMAGVLSINKIADPAVVL